MENSASFTEIYEFWREQVLAADATRFTKPANYFVHEMQLAAKEMPTAENVTGIRTVTDFVKSCSSFILARRKNSAEPSLQTLILIDSTLALINSIGDKYSGGEDLSVGNEIADRTKELQKHIKDVGEALPNWPKTGHFLAIAKLNKEIDRMDVSSVEDPAQYEAVTQMTFAAGNLFGENMSLHGYQQATEGAQKVCGLKGDKSVLGEFQSYAYRFTEDSNALPDMLACFKQPMPDHLKSRSMIPHSDIIASLADMARVRQAG